MTRLASLLAGALAVTVALPLSAQESGPTRSVVRTVESVLAGPPLDQLHWGVLAVDAESGEALVSTGAHRKFIPASNMKILVGAAALATWGPEHRFETPVRARGSFDPATGVLDGDLVVVGSGDPSLSARYWEDELGGLRALADSLEAGGLREVRGSLVVDAARWDSTSVPGSWMTDNLPWYYSAPGGAFAVAEGEVEVVVRGGAVPGAPAVVTAAPSLPDGFLDAYVHTVESLDGSGDDLSVSSTWLPESRSLRLRGSVAVGAADTLRLAVRDPVRLAAALTHRALVSAGISVRDGWRVEWDDPGGADAGEALARLRSPSLIELVEGMLEPSQNWMAEQLVRALGASDTTRAGWPTGLDELERTLVEEMGVDSLDLELRDGSGMSAYNLVTPRALVRVLRWARSRSWGEAFVAAMAEPGEDDSTLERRLPGLEGRLWAKTGTISNVNSLSGYLVGDSGRTVIFSVLTNGSGLPSARVRRGIDAVVRALAQGS